MQTPSKKTRAKRGPEAAFGFSGEADSAKPDGAAEARPVADCDTATRLVAGGTSAARLIAGGTLSVGVPAGRGGASADAGA